MADEPELQEPEPKPVEPAGDIPAPSPSPSSAEDLLAAERAETARLRAELAARPIPSPPAPPAAERLTPDRIEVAFAQGTISEAQRIQLHARVQAEEAQAKAEVARRQEDIRASTQRRIGDLVTRFPDLANAASPMIASVNAELQDLADLGYDRTDPRTHLLAVERVVGKGASAVNPREFARRRVPVGGPGGGAGTPEPTGKPDPLRGVPPDMVAYWEARGWLKDDATKLKYAQRYHEQQGRRRVRTGAA